MKRHGRNLRLYNKLIKLEKAKQKAREHTLQRFCGGKSSNDKPSCENNAYYNRTVRLAQLGYGSYEEYLSSPLWSIIRHKVLHRDNGQCMVCHQDASCVHHCSYETKYLDGTCSLEQLPFRGIPALASLCSMHHHDIEFDGKDKRTLWSANKVLKTLLKVNPPISSNK